MLTDKYFSKGNSFFQLRKYQEAIKKFNLAIKCNPDSAEAYINKGMALKALGQHQEAIRNFDMLFDTDQMMQKLMLIKEML